MFCLFIESTAMQVRVFKKKLLDYVICDFEDIYKKYYLTKIFHINHVDSIRAQKSSS
jgi:hypothetical protein